jgi:hypothetical protein
VIDRQFVEGLLEFLLIASVLFFLELLLLATISKIVNKGDRS